MTLLRKAIPCGIGISCGLHIKLFPAFRLNSKPHKPSTQTTIVSFNEFCSQNNQSLLPIAMSSNDRTFPRDIYNKRSLRDTKDHFLIIIFCSVQLKIWAGKFYFFISISLPIKEYLCVSRWALVVGRWSLVVVVCCANEFSSKRV